MTRVLHVSASPRGIASESRAIADVFLDGLREAEPEATIEHWDLWDGSLPAFGPAAAGAKMTVFGGGDPAGAQADAWRAARATFARLDAADTLVFGVPMWNAGIPYILKQLIDVVSQPGTVFGVHPETGYTGLLAGRGKRAVAIYTSAVWGPQVDARFGRDFQSTYFDDWLRWTGISEITELRFHPTLTGDADAERRRVHAEARAAGHRHAAAARRAA